MDLYASFSDIKAQADELYSKQDYLGAAEEYRKLVLGHPENPIVLRQLGLALTQGKLLDEGLRYLGTAAALQPADPETRYAYGYALGTAGRFDEAIDELDACLNLQPNHIPARQGLIFCLLTSGQEITQVNPHLGEQRLARAAKLDSKNPHVAAAYLDALVKSDQKGKAVAFLNDLESSVKSVDPVRALIESLYRDPEFEVHLKHASMAKKANPTPATPMSRSIQEVQCPSCKRPIMSYVSTCPHCNLQIRAGGTFTNRTHPSGSDWQDMAFTLTSIVWLVMAGLQFWVAYPMAQKANASNMYSAQVIASVIQGFLGLGMLFRQEWLSFIAKVYGFVAIGSALVFSTLFLSAGKGLPAALYGGLILVTGFLMYLCTAVMGD